MSLTPFGIAIRHARLETKQTLMTMGKALDLSPAFLSAVECGRKKVPLDLVPRIEAYFKELGYTIEGLEAKAHLSNTMPLVDLMPINHWLAKGK